jgi:hypothetical protein
MAQTFSISQTRIAAASHTALRDEVQSHTQNAVETSRILSAIQRFGGDPTIERFELIPSPARGFHGVGGTSWKVRALRKSEVRDSV